MEVGAGCGQKVVGSDEVPERGEHSGRVTDLAERLVEHPRRVRLVAQIADDGVQAAGVGAVLVKMAAKTVGVPSRPCGDGHARALVPSVVRRASGFAGREPEIQRMAIQNARPVTARPAPSRQVAA